nr:biotin--[acetyl-CoA-carboxylase] ligase [Saccharopolyspora sp. HNM0983]
MNPAELDQEWLRSRLVEAGPYAALDVVGLTGSTNSDLMAAAARGAVDRTVLLAEEQAQGRGRLQRQWHSPRGYGLQLSVLLRPPVPTAVLSWVPLLTGIAAVQAVDRAAGVPACLKWPNDLLLGDEQRKAAGILGELVTGRDAPAIVIGIGLNVHHRSADLPSGSSGLPGTSLAVEGAEVDRAELAVSLLTALAELDDLWRAHGGDVSASGLADRYRARCGTLGRQVRVHLGSGSFEGTATDVDDSGRLVVRGADGSVREVSAGDVVHVRTSTVR